MKQVKRVLALAVLSIGATSAMAETVNFAGTVSTSCAFSNDTAGVMNAQAINGQYVLGAGLFYSGVTPGSAATVDIAYSGAPTFSISAVSSLSSAASGAPSPSAFNTGVWFSGGTKSADNTAAAALAGANSFSNGSKSFALDGGATSDTANIGMNAVASSPWTTGNYSASTTITCQ